MARRKSESRVEPKVRVTWEKFQLVCERLEETGAKYKSCEDLGLNYSTVRDAIASATASDDLSWQELWDTSYEKFQERIEQEAFRRSMDGVERPLIGRREGKDAGDGVIGHETVYSDKLLETVLKGHFERYKDRAPVIAGGGLDVPDLFMEISPAARKAIRDIVVADLAEQAGKMKQAKLPQQRVIEG